MNVKMTKILPILIGIGMILSTVSFAAASGSTTSTATTSITQYKKIIVLTSNNPADMATAHDMLMLFAANDTQATVSLMQVDWGVYDNTIVSSIESASPDLVIIVGGDAAVPQDYVNALESDGILVMRFAGGNQYLTMYSALEWCIQQGFTYNGMAVVVDGINYAELKQFVVNGDFVLMQNTRFRIAAPLIKGLKIKQVEADQEVANQLKQEGIKVDVIITPNQTLQTILQKIKEEMMTATGPEKHKLMVEYMVINNLMKKGDDQLALKVASAFLMGSLVTNACHMKAIRKMNVLHYKLHVLMRELHRSGKMKEYKAELQEIKEYIKQGNYQKALQLIEQLIQQLTGTSTNTNTSTSTSTSTTTCTSTRTHSHSHSHTHTHTSTTSTTSTTTCTSTCITSTTTGTSTTSGGGNR